MSMFLQRRWLPVLLLLFTIGTQCWIFSNSLKDSTQSSAQSNKVVEAVRPTAEKLLPAFDIPPTESTISHLVRKTAHFSEYALLGVFTFCTMRSVCGQKKRLLLLPLPYCILTACADEWIQLSSPGRSGQWTDVLLDSCGAGFGILFAMAICTLCFSIVKKRQSSRFTN